MPLAEGVSARIAYKAYGSGAITSNQLANSASDLGASGGQVLRRVSTTLSLAKDTYQSEEIRSDRQIADFRHGVGRAQGNITGELSPATWSDFLAALFRGSWSAAVTASPTDFTSVSAIASTSKIIFGSGNPVTKGLRVGDVIRFSGLLEADNNDKNFVVLSFGGTQNRELTVHPAPEDMTADTSFTVTAFRSLMVPSSSHEASKFGIEVYNEDVDISRLFTECRVGGANIQLPATGIGTIGFDFMGRGMEVYSGGSAPFFSAPSAATTTRLLAAVNGLLRTGGSNIGVVTGFSLQIALNPEGPAVVGQNFVPEIFLGRFNATGQLTAFFEDDTLINHFVNETEPELLLYLTGSNDAAAQAMTLYLPRIKLGGAEVQTQGEGGQAITLPFQALKYEGSGAGIPATTMRVVDTELA